ncbi:MAG TPA: nicotinate-nucleotide adenylyltransferase [Chloroflexota bacterium]|nr:nicotinate-nucleotide adenylyltransferase [Chloroflexota bacterium]
MSPLPPSPPLAAPPSPLRAVGVLGGTFDPIHHAHLFSAEVAAAAHGLQRVLLVPASRSPLKSPAAGTPEDRVAMARLAAAGSPLLEVSTVEVDRPPPSYMADTLALLASRYPQAALSLILGIDALRDFLLWREPQRVLDLARLIVVPRPGYALRIPPQLERRLGPGTRGITLQPMPLLEISSTEIRRRVATGEPVRYLLPQAVEDYITRRGLYRA